MNGNDEDDGKFDFDVTPPPTDPHMRDPIELLRHAQLEHGKKIGELEQRLVEIESELRADLEKIHLKLTQTRQELRQLRGKAP